MKVLIINGSPNKNGCTSVALDELANTLDKNGIETEVIFIGNKDIRGCISCGYCRKNGMCTFDDVVNDIAKKFKEADGLVIGTPVYYSGINGTVKTFLDRLFFSTSFSKVMKVGAAVVSSRRAGSTSAIDEINKYFTICGMPVVSSSYWNEVHGSKKDDVKLDKEGLQTMRNLGNNMAFLIKSINLGKMEFELPKMERKYKTNFIDGLDK